MEQVFPDYGMACPLAASYKHSGAKGVPVASEVDEKDALFRQHKNVGHCEMWRACGLIAWIK